MLLWPACLRLRPGQQTLLSSAPPLVLELSTAVGSVPVSSPLLLFPTLSCVGWLCGPGPSARLLYLLPYQRHCPTVRRTVVSLQACQPVTLPRPASVWSSAAPPLELGLSTAGGSTRASSCLWLGIRNPELVWDNLAFPCLVRAPVALSQRCCPTVRHTVVVLLACASV